MKLEGKVALVTGAGSGIGRAIVERFIAEGARIVASDIRADRLDEVAAALNAAGALKTVTGNVADRGDIGRLLDAAAAFGRLDIVVNNAGIAPAGRFVEQSPAVWQQVMAVNVTAPMLLAQAAGRTMLAQGSGKIINVASTSGILGKATLVAYSSSKGALLQLSLIHI